MTFRLPEKLTIDSSVLIKALVPPKRQKQDGIYGRQLHLHEIALKIFEDVVRKKISMFIPSVVLIEVGAVVSRLTNNEIDAQEAVYRVQLLEVRLTP